jgi:hypothetical protein
MHNLSEILRSAWTAYRRDDRDGFCGDKGFRRNGPFCRRHFAYCLRMAWAIARERAARMSAGVKERMALIQEAGRLNNHPALISVDHVTFMGFMDVAECRQHVAKLKGMITDFERPAAVKARITAIKDELTAMEFADRMDWARRAELGAELARLTA